MKLISAISIFVIGVGIGNYAFAIDYKFYFPVGESLSEIKKQPEFQKCSEVKKDVKKINSIGITIYQCAGIEPLLSELGLYVFENKVYKVLAYFNTGDMKAYEFNKALKAKYGLPSKTVNVSNDCRGLDATRMRMFGNYCGGSDQIVQYVWEGNDRFLSIISVKTFAGEKPLEVQLTKNDLEDKVSAAFDKSRKEAEAKENSEAAKKYNF